jgi:hypothetical protein
MFALAGVLVRWHLELAGSLAGCSIEEDIRLRVEEVLWRGGSEVFLVFVL